VTLSHALETIFSLVMWCNTRLLDHHKVLFTCDAEITESEVVHNEENNVFDCRCHGHGWPRSAKEQPSETQSHDPAHLEIVSKVKVKVSGIVYCTA
jgi:hypothetical protein